MFIFKKIKFIIFGFLMIVCLFNFTVVGAVDTGLDITGGRAGFNTGVDETIPVPTLAETVGKIVGVFLSFLGIIFFVLMVYGGFMWMTARGNSEQTGKAKTVLIDAILGLIIILLAYAITSFVTTQIANSVK